MGKYCIMVNSVKSLTSYNNLNTSDMDLSTKKNEHTDCGDVVKQKKGILLLYIFEPSATNNNPTINMHI